MSNEYNPLNLNDGGGSGYVPPISNDPFEDTRTFTDEELNDPNSIVVTISDTQTPIVVLFGARTSGKTMALIRLTRFLKANGFSVIPDRVFRPGYDTRYAAVCENFERVVYSDTTEGGTGVVNFMLVKVLDKIGRPICQILEAPGEHYFDTKDPKRPFPPYIRAIATAPNRKTWAFIVEQDWGRDAAMRQLYADKICAMQSQVRPRDKVVFIVNKVDKIPQQFLRDNRPNTNQFFRNVFGQYPGIFSRYMNDNPISKLWRPYNFDFIPFSAGTFSPTQFGKEIFTPGEDAYPDMLWKAIRNQ